MGKQSVRVIVVPKWMTVSLLIIVSGAMLGVLFYLSGRAYSSGRDPMRDLLLRFLQRGQAVSPNALLAGIMPLIANVLFFMPWGFLMFLALDRPSRGRGRTYLITVAAGSLLAAGMAGWQAFLPTRVLGTTDAMGEVCGALAGALAAHLRKRIRVQFDY